MAGSRLFHLSRLKALLAALFFYTLYVIGSTYSKQANSINLTLSDVISDLPFLESRTLVEEEEPILDLEEPLNVIIFYPDDWRHDDLGDTNPSLNTPFFSRMARQGIRFTQNAVTTSICWVSRATLFTGQWVSRHGSTYLFRPIFARNPEQWNETWPSILQQYGGYWVGHVGKWQYQMQGYRNLKIFNYSDYFEGVMWYGKDHAAKRARNSAIKFLMDRPKDRPFAMTVAIYPPKGSSNPEDAVPEYLAKYQNATIPEPYDREAALKLLPKFLQDNKTDARIRYNYRFVDVNDYQTTMKTYLSVIEYIDKMCEEVIDEVHRQGIFNKTMIIITADNGEFHSNHALADKWYPYQESIRVPLIIYDPRMPKKERGTLNNAFTLNVDLAETVLGAAGLRPPKNMQGRDISDLYLSTPKSTEPWRDEFFYEFPDLSDKIPPSRALVRHDWKYIEWTKHDHEELFNLADDPFEFKDLAQDPQYAVLKKEMKEKLTELRYETMAPNIPGTVCDPLLKPGSNLALFTNCSIEKPHLCCPGTAVSQSLG